MKTHCVNGHEFTPENTLTRSDNGGRRCRTCKNESEQARYWSDGKDRTRPTVQTLGSILERCEWQDNKCLLWTGWKNPRGYGRVTYHQKKWLVHRLVWELQTGPIPPGMTVDHECHNDDPTCNEGDSCRHRACCNVNHLTLKTPKANTLSGRTIPAEWAKRSAQGIKSTRDEVWRVFQQ